MLNGGKLPEDRSQLMTLTARAGISRSALYRIKASVPSSDPSTSQSGTGDPSSDPSSASQTGIPRPDLGRGDPELTRRFVVKGTPGIRTEVVGLTPSVGPALAPRRCKRCDHELEPDRRADTLFCSPLCKKREQRARRRAASVSSLNGRSPPPARLPADQTSRGEEP